MIGIPKWRLRKPNGSRKPATAQNMIHTEMDTTSITLSVVLEGGDPHRAINA